MNLGLDLNRKELEPLVEVKIELNLGEPVETLRRSGFQDLIEDPPVRELSVGPLPAGFKKSRSGSAC